MHGIPEAGGYFLDEYDGPRFWERVDFHGGVAHEHDPLARAEGECWVWARGPYGDDDYGRFRMWGREIVAHRIAYRDFGKKIPDDMVLDHLCRNRKCVNPMHLEPVAQVVNVRRGARPMVNRDVCRNGHALSDENIILIKRGKLPTVRACRQCQKEAKRRAYLKSKARATPERSIS